MTQTNTLFSMDTEVAVLSLILQHPDLIHSCSGLRFYMFSSTPHQLLYQEFEELMEKQLVPDRTLVLASLESKKLISNVGGRQYFDSLLAGDFNVTSFTELVKMVMASYRARMYLSVTTGADKSKITPDNIDEYISNTKKALENLGEVGGATSTIQIGDIAKTTYEEIISRRTNPGIRGGTWGEDLSDLDKATGGKSAGDLIVIAGRPGQGKTALICNSVLADGLNGIPSLLIEREMRNQELFERLISIDSGVPNTNIRLGILTEEQIEKVYNSISKIKKLPIYLDTNYLASDPYYVETTVNKYTNKYGVKNVYLDYIQLLAERDENQTQEIGKMIRLFKILANDKDICSIVLSQLNRSLESRDNKRPLMSDLKQSGALEEDADFVIGLYRDEHYNPETKYKNLMEFIILKHRNGPPGTVTLKFDGPSNRITNTEIRK